MTNTCSEPLRKFTKSVIVLIMLITMNSGLIAKEIAGKTIITKGVVQASDNEPGPQRILKRRSPIYGTDVVTTEDNSKAQLRMTDGGMIALKENSELLIADYQFNAEDQTGSVVMELVKGGLRSVTGAIKSGKGNYQLKTPVGSIGIRGTHYEIEIIKGEVFIAVWDGAVDISVGVGGQEQEVPLGKGEDFSYAKIDESGEVTELLAPPENFNEGHSSSPSAKTEQPEEKSEDKAQGAGSGEKSDKQAGGSTAVVKQSEGDEAEQTVEGEGEGGPIEVAEQQTLGVTEVLEEQPSAPDQGPPGQEIIVVEGPIEAETDFITQDNVEEELALSPQEEITNLIAARTGVFVYDQVSNLVFETETGTNFAASMSINFDTSEISNGSLSFDDSNGEQWFAAFNGAINGANLDLGVNFASHGNKLADGNIDSVFTEGIDGLFNVFELFEVENTEVRTRGRFDLVN